MTWGWKEMKHQDFFSRKISISDFGMLFIPLSPFLSQPFSRTRNTASEPNVTRINLCLPLLALLCLLRRNDFQNEVKNQKRNFWFFFTYFFSQYWLPWSFSCLVEFLSQLHLSYPKQPQNMCIPRTPHFDSTRIKRRDMRFKALKVRVSN
jgi:hypothetical protein